MARGRTPRSTESRASSLFDDRAWTAGALARHVGIAPSTAGQHLAVLIDAGLLAESRRGRHRYVRLASAEVARVIEDLATVVKEPERRPNSLRTVRTSRRLAAARTCYDHLAGRLGVGVYDALVDRGLLAGRAGLVLTPAGRAWMTDFAGEAVLRSHRRRPLLRTCVDWTERRPHLGGVLGAVLCEQFFSRGWVTRSGDSRVLTIIPTGGRAIAEAFGTIDLSAHERAA